MALRPLFSDEDDDEYPVPVRGPDGRWPTVDRIERAIRYPSPWRFRGAQLEELLARRTVAERELAQADLDLAEVVARRRRLARRIERCNLAITGTSQIRDRYTGEVVQRLGWTKRIPFSDPQPAVAPDEAKQVAGRALAASATDLLRVTGRPLTLGELERLLRLEGLVPSGRASKTISDALRSEVAAGRVIRERRGCYRAA